MSLEILALAVVLLGLMAYTMFGGADFGGGVWTALAWGPRRHQQQEAVFNAMGPVWETNHIWLILVVVALFTAFPSAFAVLFIVLLAPLAVALLGIVFRGAAFAFRHFGEEESERLPASGLVFSVASLLTPFAMGVTLGATAGGELLTEAGSPSSDLWIRPFVRPFPLMAGLIGVTTCGFLTACYMTTRTSGALREDFRVRGIIGGVALGAVTTIALPVARFDAAEFWNQLVRPDAVAVISLASVMGVLSLVVLWRRWYRLAPPVAAATAALIVLGWGIAQYPYFIVPAAKITEAAAPDSVLRAFLVSLAIGSLVLIPSLVFLYRTFAREVHGG